MRLLILLVVLAALVFIAVGCDREVTGSTAKETNQPATGCLACHTDGSGPNQAILAQFNRSVHASGDNTSRNRLSDPGYQVCERCHTNEGFIAFITGVPASGDHFSAFSCFTCHQPHSEGNFNVRYTEPATLENGAVYNRGNSNICAACHHSRRDVETYVIDSVKLTSRFGPHHSNQADMLSGENAYEYADYHYSGSWHQTGVTRGCPACHMSTTADVSIGGHSCNMVNDALGLENVTGCNVDGCHGSDPLETLNRETDEDFDGDGINEGVQDEVQTLLDSLATLLVEANLLDANHNPKNNRTVTKADSLGAVYNYLFVHEDRSLGVHNTDYAVGLIKSSINFLNTGHAGGSQEPVPSLLSAH